MDFKIFMLIILVTFDLHYQNILLPIINIYIYFHMGRLLSRYRTNFNDIFILPYFSFYARYAYALSSQPFGCKLLLLICRILIHSLFNLSGLHSSMADGVMLLPRCVAICCELNQSRLTLAAINHFVHF